MLVRIYAIGLMWMFGPLPSEACDTIPRGCVDLGPPPALNEMHRAPAATTPRPERPASAHLGDLFDSGTPPKAVRTVEVRPDGTLANPTDADGAR